MAFGARIKLTVDKSNPKEFQKEIQSYVDYASKGKIELKELKIGSVKTDPVALRKKIEETINGSSDNGGIVVNVSNLNATKAIGQLKRELSAMMNGLTIDGVKAFLDNSGANGGVSNGLEEAAKAAEEVTRKTKGANAELKELGNIQRTLNSVFTDITKTKNTDNGDFLNEYENLNRKVVELRNNDAARSHEAVHNLAKEAVALKQKTNATLESEAAAKKESKASIQLATKANMLREQILRYEKANPRAYRTYTAQFDALVTQLEKIDSLTQNDLADVSRSFRTISVEAKAAGRSGSDFFDILKSGWEKFGGWTIVTKTLGAAFGYITKGVKSVIELDKAMTDLKKVTDETNTAYERFVGTAVNIAKDVGAGLSETVAATSDFARLGYSVEDSAKLAEAALIYKNVGDNIGSVEEATESLISTIKAFGGTADDAIRIVDRFNEVGNKFAINSDGIGVALQKSASSLAAANNTLDENIALITAMNAVIQNPETVGTALKTVSMYLRAAKADAEAAGEATDGMASSVSSLRKQLLELTQGKVDIMIDDSTFKSTYQIVKELSAVWSSLADVDTAAILELIGGKRNATAVTSLLTNFKDAEAALKTSTNSAGSAVAENERMLDSFNGKVKILQASFESLSASLLDSGWLKWLADSANGLVSFAEGLNNVNLLLPAIAVSFGAVGWNKRAHEISGLVSRLAAIDDVVHDTSGAMDAIIASYHGMSMAQQKAVLMTLDEAAANNTLSASKVKEIKARLTGIQATNADTAAKRANKGATDALNASTKTMLATNWVGWITLAISLIPGLIDLIGKIHKSNDELIEDAKNLKDEYSNAINTIDSNLKTLKGLESEFQTLSNGVGEYGENISLNADQYERYQEIVSTILDISPSLINSYDAEGRAIANKNGLLEEAIRLEESLRKNEVRQYVSEDSLKTTFAGEFAKYKKALKDAAFDAFADDRGKWSSHTYGGLSKIYLPAIANAIGEEWNALNDTPEYESVAMYVASHYDAIQNNLSKIVDNIKQSLPDVTQEQIGKVLSFIKTAGEETSSYLKETLLLSASVTDGYDDLSNASMLFVGRFADSFKLSSRTSKQDFLAMRDDIEKLIKTINDNDDFKFIISLGMQFEDGAAGKTMSVKDYQLLLETFKSDFEELTDSEKMYIKLAFGFEGDETQWQKDLDFQLNRLQHVLDKEAYSKIEAMIEDGSLKMADIDLISGLDFTNIRPGDLGFDQFISMLESARIQINDSADRLQQSLSSLRPKIELLKRVKTEFEQTGSVSAASYRDVVRILGEDYTEMFDLSGDRISLHTDKIKENVDALVDQEKALLLAAGSAESDLQAIEDLTDGFEDLTGATEELISSLESLSSVLETAKNGKAMGVLETIKLIQQYPELAGAIQKTTEGYILEEGAIRDLIEAKIDMIEVDGLIAESGVKAARAALDTIYGSQRATNAIDRVLQKYERANGRAVQSMEEFRSAWDMYAPSFDLDISSESVQSLINSILTFNKAYEVMTGIVSGANSDTLFSPEGTGNATDPYEERMEAFKDYLNDAEHQLFLKERAKASADEMIAVYSGLLEDIETKISEFRALGLDDNSDYIQELEKQWWDYKDTILELRQSMFSDDIDDRKFGIETLKKNGSDAGEIIDSWKDILQSINREIEYYAEQGYDSADDVMRDLIKMAWDAKDEIVSAIEDTVSEANGVVDGLQGVYSTLKDAAKEYASTGALSVDNLQSILSLGPQYLSFLYNESGQLVINEQALQQVIAAKTNDMAATTALAYAEQVLAAAEQNDIQTLISLTQVTAASTNATWDMAYATLALAKAIGLAQGMDGGYFDNAVSYIDKMQSLTQTAIQSIPTYYQTLEEGYVNRADALDQVLQSTQDMIKWENEQQIEALEKEKELHKDIVDQKKEALKLAKKESERERDVADKLEEIARLQSRIEQLSLDDSREAQAERRGLEEELNELQKDLADDQADYAYDTQVDALDKEYDAYEKNIDRQIKSLEGMLDSTEELYQSAISRIDNNWDSLYSDLMSWNSQYGSSVQSDLVSAWDAASEAVQRYGSFTAALDGVKNSTSLGAATTIGGLTTGTTAGSSNPTAPTPQPSVGNTSTENVLPVDSRVTSIVNAMKKNSQEWNKTSDPTTRARLEQNNERLAKMIEERLGKKIVKSANGVWWIGSVGGQQLYDVYHAGGIVGGNPTLKQNEVMAILEKGEAVLDKEREEGLYKIVDFAQVLSEKLGKVIDLNGFAKLTSGELQLPPMIPAAPMGGVTNNSSFSPVVSVTINHNGSLTEDDAKRYGGLVADSALDKLSDAFAKRGIGGFGNAILKQ